MYGLDLFLLFFFFFSSFFVFFFFFLPFFFFFLYLGWGNPIALINIFVIFDKKNV